jgi:hypothetical protein
MFTFMRRRIIGLEDRGLGVTRHDVSVKLTDTQPQLLFATTSGVNNTASALHSFRAQTIGIAAMELLEASRVSSVGLTARLRSENKWIAL